MGRLADPERPTSASGSTGDVVRTTGSLHYSRPVEGGNAWSTSLIWGRNHSVATKGNSNSYLAESVYPFGRRNFVTGRAELVDKDELFVSDAIIEGQSFRIQAYTAGFTRDIGAIRNLETGIGANATAYAIPAAIKPYYGDHPWGVNVFVRVRLKPAAR
jgi:hypothetical protein